MPALFIDQLSNISQLLFMQDPNPRLRQHLLLGYLLVFFHSQVYYSTGARTLTAATARLRVNTPDSTSLPLALLKAEMAQIVLTVTFG